MNHFLSPPRAVDEFQVWLSSGNPSSVMQGRKISRKGGKPFFTPFLWKGVNLLRISPKK